MACRGRRRGHVNQFPVQNTPGLWVNTTLTSEKLSSPSVEWRVYTRLLCLSVCLSQPEGFHLIFFHTKIRGTSFFFDMCTTDEYVIGALQRQNRICILETTFMCGHVMIHILQCKNQATNSEYSKYSQKSAFES